MSILVRNDRCLMTALYIYFQLIEYFLFVLNLNISNVQKEIGNKKQSLKCNLWENYLDRTYLFHCISLLWKSTAQRDSFFFPLFSSDIRIIISFVNVDNFPLFWLCQFTFEYYIKYLWAWTSPACSTCVDCVHPLTIGTLPT